MIRITRRDNDEGQEKTCWISTMVLSFLIVVVVNWLWPSVIPFDTFEFWRGVGSPLKWIQPVGCLLLWGLFLAFVSRALNRDAFRGDTPGEILGVGFIASLFAGVWEEMAFRWAIFLASIATCLFFNFLVFGFLGFGVLEFIYLFLVGPIANWATFGYLEPYLYHPAGWVVGCAIVTANAQFRDGHKYQGPFGLVNSWFIGMFMFYLLFQHGLVVCIIAHFLYDMLIYGVHAAMSALGEPPSLADRLQRL